MSEPEYVWSVRELGDPTGKTYGVTRLGQVLIRAHDALGNAYWRGVPTVPVAFTLDAAVRASFLTAVSKELVAAASGRRLDDAQFRKLMDLLMCSDPWPVKGDPDNQPAVESIVRAEASARGYDSWIVAYHEFGKEDVGP